MRRFAPVLATFVLLSAPAFAQKPPAQTPPQQQQPQQQRPQRPPAQQPQGRPQQQEAVAPQGWRREVADTGTVYFYCAGASTCREGDVVSYRMQAQGEQWSLDRFRQQQERANRDMLSDGTLRNVEMAGPRDETHENTIVFVADKTLTDSNGRESAMISAYIAIGQQHLTLVATAPSLSTAGDNIGVFRSALISSLGGRPH